MIHAKNLLQINNLNSQNRIKLKVVKFKTLRNMWVDLSHLTFYYWYKVAKIDSYEGDFI